MSTDLSTRRPIAVFATVVAVIISSARVSTAGSMVERASLAADGGDASGQSVHPHIAPGGRYVAFTSNADNIGEGSGSVNIWLRDLQANTTERVTVTLDGRPPN